MERTTSSRRANARGRLALGALTALIVLAAAGSALAQTGRGQLVVLGLRAPNGEDEAATNVTIALRRAASQAGFQVPESSPALEQEIATFQCQDTVPLDCLAQIANDVHADRILYGSVRRRGRGPTAQIAIEVSLYSRPAGGGGPGTTEAAPPVEVARSTVGDAETQALRTTASGIVTTLLPVPASSGGGGNGGNGGGTGPIEAPVTPPPGAPFPVVRVIGVGVTVVGVGMLAAGIVGAASFFSIEASQNREDTAWYRFQPFPTRDENANSAAVCQEAVRMNRTDVLEQVCNPSYAMSTLAWTMIPIGAAVTAVGVILIATGGTREPAPSAPPSNAALRRQLRRPQLTFTPTLTPHLQAGSFQLRF